jgi:hypothetical protein
MEEGDSGDVCSWSNVRGEGDASGHWRHGQNGTVVDLGGVQA